MLVRFEGNDADKNKKMQEEKKTLATLQEALRQHLDKDKDKDEPRTRPDKKWGVKMLRDALKVAHDGGSVDDIAEKLGVKGGFPTSKNEEKESEETLATLHEDLRQHLDEDGSTMEGVQGAQEWGVEMLRDALKVAHDGGSVNDIAKTLGVKGGFPTSGLDGLEATVRLDQLRHPREVFDGENGWGLHANQDVRVRSSPFSTRVLTCFFLSSRIGAPAS